MYSDSVLIAGLLHLCLVLVLLRPDRHRFAPESPDSSWSVASLTLVLFSMAFLVATLLSGFRQDYVIHLRIWDWVLDGTDPWVVDQGSVGPLNAYGPLFSALAPLSRLNPFAPKLLFAATYLAFVIWLVKDAAHEGGRVGLSPFAIVAWVINPFPWIEVAYFGHFDILIGVTCIAAIRAQLRGSDFISGTWLALGALFKFLPVVVLPFLVVDRWRVRFRLLLAAALTILLGLLGAALIWGSSVVRALALTTDMSSELLSIFRFLRDDWSPLRRFVEPTTVDALATPCLMAAGLLIFVWWWVRSYDATKGAVLAVLTTVTFYHVGFIQYRFVPFVLVTYWYWTTREAGSPARDAFLRFAMVTCFGSLAVFDAFYAAVGGIILPDGPWGWIQRIAGAPAFILECVLVAAVLRSNRRPVMKPEAAAPIGVLT